MVEFLSKDFVFFEDWPKPEVQNGNRNSVEKIFRYMAVELSFFDEVEAEVESHLLPTVNNEKGKKTHQIDKKCCSWKMEAQPNSADLRERQLTVRRKILNMKKELRKFEADIVDLIIRSKLEINALIDEYNYLELFIYNLQCSTKEVVKKVNKE